MRVEGSQRAVTAPLFRHTVGAGNKGCCTIQGYFSIFPTYAIQIVPSLSVKELIYYSLLIKKVKS